MRSHGVKLAVAVLLGSLIAGCGSTVPLGTAANNSDGSGSNLSLGTGATGVSGLQAGTTPGQLAGMGQSGSAGLASTAVPSAGPGAVSGSTPTTGSGKQGPTPILIGLSYIDNGQQNAILGGIGSGLQSADAKGETTDYAAAINKRGGILGHPIKMIYSQVDTGGTLQEAEQSACSKYTEDYHVAVTFDPSPTGLLYTCLTKAGVAAIYPGIDGLTRGDYAKWPLVREPDSFSLERLAQVEVAQLPSLGFEPTGRLDKLGVLYFDQSEYVTGFHALGADWKTRGVAIGASAAVTPYNSVSTIGNMEAQVQSAELKFRAEGVTHVMCVETNAWLCGFFGVYAGSQNYYPKYAWTSNEPLNNVISNVPERELQGSVFLGWNPAQDMVSIAKMPAPVRHCLSRFSKMGYPTQTGNERGQAAAICEAYAYLEASVKAAGGGITSADIAAGALRVASTYTSSLGFAVGNRADGVAAIRKGVFDSGCACFAYTSGLIRV